MLRFIRNAFIGSSLLLFGAAAYAQIYQDRDDFPRRTDRYYDRGYYNGNMVGQVRADLDQPMSMPYLSHDQRKVLNKAREDLRDFDRASNGGKFDRHELDEAIARIQSVADSGRISEETRAMLMDDANRLRDLRANNGHTYSYRNNGYYDRDGYRNNGYYDRDGYRNNGYYDRYGNWHSY